MYYRQVETASKLSLAVADFFVGIFALPLVLLIYVRRLRSHPFTYLNDQRIVISVDAMNSRTTPVSDECGKNIESKTWLDSKILINICGFIWTTVIFASLFSLFFASVDRFSFRVFNRHLK